MPEQAVPTLLGAMGTALVTAVGALAWMVKGRSNGNHTSSLNACLTDLSTTLKEETAALRDLAEASRLHSTESRSRHEMLLLVLDQLKAERIR